MTIITVLSTLIGALAYTMYCHGTIAQDAHHSLIYERLLKQDIAAMKRELEGL